MRHSQSPRDRSPAQPRTGKPFRAPARDGFARLLVAAVLSCWVSQAIGEVLPKRFTDPDDGKLDLSEWLLDHKGFLPVPIIITEPAVGYGAGVALAFFRESLRDTAERSTASGRRAPPDVFGVGALATENGTKGAALGGQWTFVDGRYLYRGGVADVSINLDFYGVGGQLPGPIDKVGYELSGFGSFQQGMVRLGDSDVYAGVRWIYLDLSASLDVAAGDIGLSPRQMAKRSSGAGVAIEHDSRDNIFTPNRGWIGALEATFYSPEIGSSNTFQAYRAHVFDYHQLSRDWILGLRADGRLARGDVPFYMLPFIDMRGIPAARFQEANIAVLETEVRYNLDERWAVVGFLGTGRAWGNRVSYDDADTPVSGGLGFRYLIARRLGLYAGIDVAKSTVDQAFYIQVGNGWR
jgi:hypothetical protein